MLGDRRVVGSLPVAVAPATIDLGDLGGSTVEKESIALADLGVLGGRPDELASRALDSQNENTLRLQASLGERPTCVFSLLVRRNSAPFQQPDPPNSHGGDATQGPTDG